ncbi:Ricin-type beta-trefoil lectin domain containing protein 1 [Sarcoptes scabiei]|uniref:Ricin-type beta-trefoil lectin domain containing protein 1 n=1 Tax=Sarcoptes scabiei TaxID=52283 RepID=A0A132A6D7_SARSC|nr:Ricin-type beta-trefoil lectin domain containing protein 1 [Sarcoptes scabiei]
MPLNYFSLGEIKNKATRKCLDTFGRKSGENIALGQCHGLGGNQVFAYTKRQQIMSDDNCLDATSMKSPIKLVRCHGMGVILNGKIPKIIADIGIEMKSITSTIKMNQMKCEN